MAGHLAQSFHLDLEFDSLPVQNEELVVIYPVGLSVLGEWGVKCHLLSKISNYIILREEVIKFISINLFKYKYDFVNKSKEGSVGDLGRPHLTLHRHQGAEDLQEHCELDT